MRRCVESRGGDGNWVDGPAPEAFECSCFDGEYVGEEGESEA